MALPTISNLQVGIGVIVIGVVAVVLTIIFVVRSIKKRKNIKSQENQENQVTDFYPGVNKMAQIKPKQTGIVKSPKQNLVDIDALTVEEMEAMLEQKREQSVESDKRARLNMMSKEQLIELVVSNQIEF